MNIIKIKRNNKILFLIFFIIVYLIYINLYYSNNKLPFKDTEYKNKKYFTDYEYKYIHNILLENLDKTIKILKKHNIEYWAIGGTLLGSIRENKIIDKDDDIDLGMLESDFNKLKNINDHPNLLKDFNDNNLHLINDWGIVKILSKRKDNNYTINKIFIDIMGIKEDNNKYFYSDLRHRTAWKNSWYNKNELFPLKYGKLNHINLNIPRKGEEYLKRVYGYCTGKSCWKIPSNEEAYHKDEINLNI